MPASVKTKPQKPAQDADNAGKRPTKNPLRAIRRKCLDCSGGSTLEVKECVMDQCALWPFRFGRNPYDQKSQILEPEEDFLTEERQMPLEHDQVTEPVATEEKRALPNLATNSSLPANSDPKAKLSSQCVSDTTTATQDSQVTEPVQKEQSRVLPNFATNSVLPANSDPQTPQSPQSVSDTTAASATPPKAPSPSSQASDPSKLFFPKQNTVKKKRASQKIAQPSASLLDYF